MRCLLYSVIAWVPVMSLTGCTSASFSGTTPNRAKSSETATLIATATLPELEPQEGPTNTSSSESVRTDPNLEANEPQTSTNNDPSASTSTNPEVAIGSSPQESSAQPVCADQTRSIGGQVAILIDNSQSNEATDCPFPVATGGANSSGHPLYRCELATNREKSVLAVFDLLQKIAEKEPDNQDALSSIAVSSFPASELGGYKIQSAWQKTEKAARDQLEKVMRFTRRPVGQTPYGEALTGAQTLFGQASDDSRGKLAILVTDGLPTDRNPESVSAQAEALRNKGVKVVTVYVTGPAERAKRYEDHRSLLATFEEIYQAKNQHWYDIGIYKSFSSYMTAIFGLAQKVSRDEIIEVQDSSLLEKTLLTIVQQKVIRCDR